MSVAKRPVALVALLACVVALALSACGSSSNSNGGTQTSGAVSAGTGFVVHAGAAFFLFHHWIYNAYKQGKLNIHHPFTLAKAAVAGAAAYHESKVALTDLRKNPKLAKLATPFTALVGSFAGLKALIKNHNLSSIGNIENSISSIKNRSASSGTVLNDVKAGL